MSTTTNLIWWVVFPNQIESSLGRRMRQASA
jgi:hypothetical protein